MLLKTQINIKKVAQLTGHNASIFALAMGKDQQHILSAGGEGWVAEWNLAEPEMGNLVAKANAQLFSVHRIRNKNEILAGNMNGGLHWTDLDDNQHSKDVLQHKKGIYAIQELEDYILTGGGDGYLTKWDKLTKTAIESLQLSSKSMISSSA